MKRHLAGMAAAACGAIATAHAQQSPPLPTFQSQVTYVELVVSVTGPGGAFVPGLSAADFEVLEDGEPQAIESLAMVDLAAERAAVQAPLAEPDVRSNERPFAGRVWVLALDAINTAPDRSENVRQIARLFVERALGPDDLMAIVTLSDFTGAYQELTGSRGRLLQALGPFVGEALPPMVIPEATARDAKLLALPTSGLPRQGEVNVGSTELARMDNALKALRKLRTVADWAASVHGRRKAIVWLSEGISHDVASELGTDQKDASGLGAAAVGLGIRDTAGVISRADVNIYAIDTAGLTVETMTQNPARWLAQSNMRLMAESTGGFALTNSNNYGAAFDRLVRENSSYYVLTYSPAASHQRDGRYHRIRVRVKRPGVTARTREGYLSARGRVEAAPPLVTDAGLSPQLKAVMQSPLPVSGLPIRVAAVPFKAGGRQASVLLTGEVPASAFTGSHASLELSYAAIDGTPAVRGSQTLRSQVAAGSPLLARARQSGIAFARRLELAPGRYQLRVGARDATRGVSGSVLYDLDVPDFAADPLAMSGVVLGVTRGTQPVMAHDEPIEAALGTHPVPRRRLSAADGEAVVHVEVYDHDPAPHDVAIAVTVTGASGPAVFEETDERRSRDAEGGVHRYTLQIPLAEIAPGDYVLTVEAASRAAGGGTVQRRVPISIDR
jgi:VWFA-related protein